MAAVYACSLVKCFGCSCTGKAPTEKRPAAIVRVDMEERLDALNGQLTSSRACNL